MQRAKPTHRVAAPLKSLAAESSFNDDSAEKRKRREERVANKHLERQKVVAAATHGSPLRSSNHTVPTSPPRTPNGTVLQSVDGPHTPVRKVPILANFEEWMKMATDNVIPVLFTGCELIRCLENQCYE
jgi:condensin complex subunit 2